MEVSGDSSVTAVDVAEHPVVGPLAAGRGELTGLALWLMAERRQVRRTSPALKIIIPLMPNQDVDSCHVLRYPPPHPQRCMVQQRTLENAERRVDTVISGQALRCGPEAEPSVLCLMALIHHCCCIQGSRSTHAPFLATLPTATLSPLLWTEEQLGLIRGSPVMAEARTRRAALEAEWTGIAESVAADPSLYPPGADAHTAPPANGHERCSHLTPMRCVTARATLVHCPTIRAARTQVHGDDKAVMRP